MFGWYGDKYCILWILALGWRSWLRGTHSCWLCCRKQGSGFTAEERDASLSLSKSLDYLTWPSGLHRGQETELHPLRYHLYHPPSQRLSSLGLPPCHVRRTSLPSLILNLFFHVSTTSQSKSVSILFTSQTNWQCAPLGKSLRYSALPIWKNESKLAGHIKCHHTLSFPTGNNRSRVRLQKSWWSFNKVEVSQSGNSPTTPCLESDARKQTTTFTANHLSLSSRASFYTVRCCMQYDFYLWRRMLSIREKISLCTNRHLDCYFVSKGI